MAEEIEIDDALLAEAIAWTGITDVQTLVTYALEVAAGRYKMIERFPQPKDD